MSPKKIPLRVWAEQHYSPPPSRPTLRKWREEGQIYPAPEPVAPFYVEATARQRPRWLAHLRGQGQQGIHGCPSLGRHPGRVGRRQASPYAA